MKTLNQFKAEEGIGSIDLMQKNGRAFATVKEKSLIVAENCDMKKPLFVIKVEKNAAGDELTNVYAICNSDAKVVATV
jgi:hypothetical protein